MKIPKISIIKAIFQFDPITIGIGPKKIIPPNFDDLLVLLFFIL